jgi:hypothetical protein
MRQVKKETKKGKKGVALYFPLSAPKACGRQPLENVSEVGGVELRQLPALPSAFTLIKTRTAHATGQADGPSRFGLAEITGFASLNISSLDSWSGSIGFAAASH